MDVLMYKKTRWTDDYVYRLTTRNSILFVRYIVDTCNVFNIFYWQSGVVHTSKGTVIEPYEPMRQKRSHKKIFT